MVAAEEAKLKEIQAESAPKENGNGHVAETETKKDDVAAEKLEKVESKKRAREDEDGEGEEPADKKANTKTEAVEAAA